MDASGGPEREYENHPLRWLQLGLGAARIPLPQHWPIREHDLIDLEVGIAEIPSATFSVSLNCLEDPAAIAANELLQYVNHPDVPSSVIGDLDHIQDENGRPDFTKLTVHFGCTEGGRPGEDSMTAEVDIWRRLWIAGPDHMRVLEFQFRTPAGGDPAYRAEMKTTLDALIDAAEGDGPLTRMDKVAPTHGLKLVNFDGMTYMRVPEDWQSEREFEDGTGRYLFDDRASDRWTLWLNHTRLGSDGALEEAEIRAIAKGLMESRDDVEGSFDPLEDRPGEALVRFVFDGDEGGIPLRFVCYVKIAAAEGGAVLGHFDWVYPARHETDADMPALCALVEREVRNAIVLSPPAQPERSVFHGEPDAEGWRSITLWDTLRLRVPGGVVPQHDDEDTGPMCKFDDPGREMWTLWVRRVAVPTPLPDAIPDREARIAMMREISDDLAEKLVASFDEDREVIATHRLEDQPPPFILGFVIVFASTDQNDGERLRHMSWHRFTMEGDQAYDCFFEWVIVERALQDPAMRALSVRIAEEVMRAEIVTF